MNTIRNEVEYNGYFNIKYKKLDNLIMTMFIDGEKFEFTYWDTFIYITNMVTTDKFKGVIFGQTIGESLGLGDGWNDNGGYGLEIS